MYIEKQDLLRTKELYEGEILSGISTTGLKENCVFNEIPKFHIAENFTVDPMHDISKGIGHYNNRQHPRNPHN